jgi:outer membrane protein OmpA-like peptidoglycan-associated protein
MLRTLSLIFGMMLLVTACGENVQTAALQKPPAATPLEPRTWMVFFDTDSVKLSEQANATVGAASAIARSDARARVTVSGYTDTEGNPAYNQALSVRRANAVRDALVRSGVPAQSIAVVGEGEMAQLVPTGDQVKYPSNRRVAIVVR